jgi:hypothetical protein
VSPTNATNKAKDVGETSVIPSTQPRYALYRYRTNLVKAATVAVEAIDATCSKQLRIDKIIVRTEPRSVEMYEVEKDWDGKSDTSVRVDEYKVLIADTDGYFDIYHYKWGTPLTVEVVAKGYSANPSPAMGVHCARTPGGSGWKQAGLTVTLNTMDEVYGFAHPEPDYEGMIVCRVRSGNYKDIGVDKLLMKQRLPVDTNAAPAGYFAADWAVDGLTTTVTAAASVTDPDGDAIASYFWDFGHGRTYCSGNPLVTHTYTHTGDILPITLYATDHRGRTAIIPQR